MSNKDLGETSCMPHRLEDFFLSSKMEKVYYRVKLLNTVQFQTPYMDTSRFVLILWDNFMLDKCII